MPDTTTTLSALLNEIQACVEDKDLDAARFLREGVQEASMLGDVWLTPDEETLLASF